MTKRAFLIGDGQLHLFVNLEILLRYIEWPEAATGEYTAYIEDGTRWKLEAEIVPAKGRWFAQDSKIVVSKFDAEGDDVKREMLDEVKRFLESCGEQKQSLSFESAFDFVQKKYGFTR